MPGAAGLASWLCALRRAALQGPLAEHVHALLGRTTRGSRQDGDVAEQSGKIWDLLTQPRLFSSYRLYFQGGVLAGWDEVGATDYHPAESRELWCC